MLRVTIGGVPFVADRAAPFSTAEPYTIGRDGLTGWWGRPDGEGGGTPRPGRHGEFDEDLYLAGRIITLRGLVKAHPDSRQAALDRLSALGADGERLQIVVDEDGVEAWAWCRVRSCPIGRATAGHHPEFTLTARAADPRKYGAVHESVSTGGPAVASHDGNFAAHQRITVTGSMPGYSLTSGGRAFIVPGPLGAGQSDVVDMRTGIVKRNGVVVVGVTPRTWDVPAGVEVTWALAPAGGTGTATSSTPDTYV